MEDAGAVTAGLIALGRQVAEAGLVLGAGGNLSARVGERVWISASGTHLGELAAPDLVEMDLSGQALSDRRPSSEWRMHLAAYRARPEAQWVVHAHGRHSIALGLLDRALPALTPDQYLYLGARVPLVRWQTPTTEQVARPVEEALCGGAVAVLLQNHGALVTAPDAERARMRLALLEESAHILLLALAGAGGGPVQTLSDEAMRELDEVTGGRYKF